MSFLKYRGQTQGNGRGNLFWSRADSDGAPFRGPFAPLLREEEFEAHAERVLDFHYGTFDTSDPEQRIDGRTYREIVDSRLNDWFEIYVRDYKWKEGQDGSPVMFVYIEWGEPYQEIDQHKLGSIAGSNKVIDKNARRQPPAPAGRKQVFLPPPEIS